MDSDSDSLSDTVKSMVVRGGAPPQFVLKNTFKMFTQYVKLKLDENNFCSWKQQIEGNIRTHCLYRLLLNPIILPPYLSDEDRTVDKENPEFLTWEQQDSLLFTWHITKLYDFVLPHVIRCVHSHHIRDEIHQYMFSHTNAKLRQLRSELKSITKGDKSITEYLARI